MTSPFRWQAGAVSPFLDCPNCYASHGGRMKLRHRRSDGAPFWGCERWPLCKATHGAHPDGKPLGVPGTPETKEARKRAHAAFDRLWSDGHMPRNAAYAWLSRAMGLPREKTHIGAFTSAQCEQAERLSMEKFESVSSDPHGPDRDQIRALLAERFGRSGRARRKSRQWLGARLGKEGSALVHELSGLECKAALEALEGERHVHDAT